MFVINKITTNVKWFALNEKYCLYNTKNQVLNYNTNEIIYESTINLQEVFYANKFYINNLYGRGIYFDDNLKPIVKDYYIQSFEKEFIMGSKREGEIRNTIFENINNTKLYKINDTSTTNLLNHKFLFRKNFDKNLIEVFSFPDATPLWQYDVSELGAYDVLFSTEKRNYEVVKFLGVWQEELLVAFQGSLLMAFDVQTGKVTRQWQELPAHADEELKNIFRGKIHEKGTVFQLNLAGDKIVAIYLRHYLEIDLATSEIHVKNLSQTLNQHLMVDFNHKSGYAEDETHFYTTVHLDQEKLGLKYIPTALCALNKSTLEIDWFHRFDQDGTGDYVSVQIPQVAHNKLYQLTQNNVLYVFEKE